MAWATKKQFAILNQNDKGKSIIKGLPNMSQDDFSKKFSAFINENGGEKADVDEKKEDDREKLEPKAKAEVKSTEAKPSEEKPGKDSHKISDIEGTISKKQLKETIDDMISKYHSDATAGGGSKDKTAGAVESLTKLEGRLGLTTGADN